MAPSVGRQRRRFVGSKLPTTWCHHHLGHFDAAIQFYAESLGAAKEVYEAYASISSEQNTTELDAEPRETLELIRKARLHLPL